MDEPIDNTNEDPRYWDRLLAKMNLGMNRGHRPNRTSFRGGINELVIAEEIQLDKDSGHVRPPGHGPDKGT
jgi:hypothetical protein